MKQQTIRVTEPTPCFLPENRDIFDEVIQMTVGADARPDSKRRRPWIEQARRICGTCPEREQCLSVHGSDYELGVIAGATDDQRRRAFEGGAA